jgi:transcriptional regulator with GAF, ATPase, and Fis domain
MRDLPDLAALLVGPDPRLAADRTLGFLIARSRARGGAVLQLREGEPVPFTTRDLPAARLAETAALWRAQQQRLVAGKTVRVGDGMMVPLRDEGTLVGALYLEEVGTFDEAGVGASLLTLTKAVGSRDHVETLATYLPAVPADEILREQMLAALDRNEWNISKVARILGVARRTVYLRLERYGIPRKRVPKTLS